MRRGSFVAILLAAMAALGGCASSPPPRHPPAENFPAPPPVVGAPVEADDEWDGSGGTFSLRARGEELAEIALSLRGSPYRYGGATTEGFDCSGLVFFTHRQLGLKVPRTSRDQANAAENVKRSNLRRGDLLFFTIGGRRVNHVGIYIGKDRFVHAPGAGKAVTINSLDDDFYARTFVAAGRLWNRLPE